MRRFLIAVFCCVLVVLLPSAPAHSHSALEESAPAPGERIGSGLDRISLRFAQLGSDQVQLTLTDDAETVLHIGEAVVIDEQVVCAAIDPLAAGVYTLSYRVISSDGDPVKSAFIFQVRDHADAATPLAACAQRELPVPKAPASAAVEENTQGSSVTAWKMWLAILALPLGVVLLVFGLKVFRWYAQR